MLYCIISKLLFIYLEGRERDRQTDFSFTSLNSQMPVAAGALPEENQEVRLNPGLPWERWELCAIFQTSIIRKLELWAEPGLKSRHYFSSSRPNLCLPQFISPLSALFSSLSNFVFQINSSWGENKVRSFTHMWAAAQTFGPCSIACPRQFAGS